MLTNDERRRLVDLLCNVPAAETYPGRTAIIGAPAKQLNRSEQNPRIDFDGVILHLVEAGDRDKLIEIIKNAMAYVRGMGVHEELERVLQQLGGRTRPAWRKMPAHMFDLSSIVEEWFERVDASRGLVGFGIHSESPYAYESKLCERFQEVLSRSECDFRRLGALSASFGVKGDPVGDLAGFVRKSTKPNVLVSIRATTHELALRFWQAMCTAFSSQGAPTRRVIVVLALKPNLEFPEQVIPLASPRFRKAHAMEWCRQAAEALVPAPQVDKMHVFLANSMVEKCSEDGMLDVELVYRFLGEVEGFFGRQLGAEEIRSKIEEWS